MEVSVLALHLACSLACHLGTGASGFPHTLQQTYNIPSLYCPQMCTCLSHFIGVETEAQRWEVGCPGTQLAGNRQDSNTGPVPSTVTPVPGCVAVGPCMWPWTMSLLCVSVSLPSRKQAKAYEARASWKLRCGSAQVLTNPSLRGSLRAQSHRTNDDARTLGRVVVRFAVGETEAETVYGSVHRLPPRGRSVVCAARTTSMRR